MFLTMQTITPEKLKLYWQLTRFHKPIGILLLLWPTLWALWIAGAGQPSWSVVLVFVLGVTLMRAAGCVINDYADRDIDPHVERTRNRPLANGSVKPNEALALFGGLIALAFLLVLLMNRLTILLSFGGAFLAALYPFMKRYTHLPQLFLGLAFAWAVPMAFAAQQNEVPPIAWLIFVATVIWAIVYDTMYAMVDRDDDIKIGVKSTALLFGDLDRLFIGGLQLLLLLALIAVGMQAGLGWCYGLGLLAAAGLSLYQQKLIAERRREDCFKAFLNNNWYGMAVFLGIFADYLIR